MTLGKTLSGLATMCVGLVFYSGHVDWISFICLSMQVIS